MLSDEAKAHVLGMLLEMQLEGVRAEIYLPPNAVDEPAHAGLRNLYHLQPYLLVHLKTARNRYDLRGDALNQAVLDTRQWRYLRNFAPVLRFVAELELERRT